MTGTDWPLTIATIGGAVAVAIAAGVAAYVAVKVNKWQGGARYREGLNEQRRSVYPRLIRWTDQMSASVSNMTPGSSLDPVTLDHYEQLWCCASPDLLHAVTELSKAWPDLEKVEKEIENVRLQARWDLFGIDGFEWGARQKFDPKIDPKFDLKIDPKIEGGGMITYGVQKFIKNRNMTQPPFWAFWRKKRSVVAATGTHKLGCPRSSGRFDEG